ncbi:MAG: bifunctional 4-hydroxy-2-oxoglutarate aldolase/2-dehydro-3-deoxy-phosphogluconate aldolase [Planctomycetota bacterium]
MLQPSPSNPVVDALCELGVVAVVRMPDASKLRPTVDALCEGGVHGIEVTLTVPGAIDAVRSLVQSLGDDHLVGVGSVVHPDQAQRAIDAGAKYVVSPVLRPAVVDLCQRHGVAVMCAGATPTEILDAHDAGSNLVKVFPADLGGPTFLKSVLAPMPWLKLLPTGGVTPDNATEWIRAGAAAVGIGSALVDLKLIEASDFAGITSRAKKAVAGVRAARV